MMVGGEELLGAAGRAAYLEFYTKWKCQIWGWNEEFFRNEKAENMYHQHTHTIRNVQRSPLVGRKIIPGGNMDLYKGI